MTLYSAKCALSPIRILENDICLFNSQAKHSFNVAYAPNTKPYETNFTLECCLSSRASSVQQWTTKTIDEINVVFNRKNVVRVKNEFSFRSS